MCVCLSVFFVAEDVETFLGDFETSLTRSEWAAIRACAPQGPAAVFRAFFVFWYYASLFLSPKGWVCVSAYIHIHTHTYIYIYIVRV